ncbi:class 1 fructose-bisphosphatase [Rubrivirga sp.]|uniref:class 1 fructose-bisphosphatase n=1 Tax=Rubrivirga sp. TaxID=1885344 RepID=UPI003B516270
MEISTNGAAGATLATGGGAFKTLEQFIIEREADAPGSKGQFSRLLRDIAVAAKIVDRDVRKAGLVDLFGDTGAVNVQDEDQKKLDLLAHEEFVRALRRGGEVCLIGSEEHAEAIPLLFDDCQGKYVVLFDPLDGSSNIDVNVSIGTIFSIYRIPDDHVGHVTVESALQCGRRQVAAGYVVYGSSTILVYTTGNGVNGFTLDPSIGEFLLSHPDIRTPERGRIYSVNEGNYNSWEDGLKRYIKWMQRDDPADDDRPYTTRYIGSFVSDVHRNMLKGGIYIYPSNPRSPQGKLRLMYEANPMAFIVEQAGGRAETGHGPILDVEPQALHDRTPVYLGSPGMVADAVAFLRGERTE